MPKTELERLKDKYYLHKQYCSKCRVGKTCDISKSLERQLELKHELKHTLEQFKERYSY